MKRRGKGWPVIGLLGVVGTPTWGEEGWPGWENKHGFKQGRKEKAKDVAQEGKEHR